MATHPETSGVIVDAAPATKALLMLTHLVAAVIAVPAVPAVAAVARRLVSHLRASAPSRAWTMSSTRSLASPKSIWLFSL